MQYDWNAWTPSIASPRLADACPHRAVFGRLKNRNAPMGRAFDARLGCERERLFGRFPPRGLMRMATTEQVGCMAIR